MESCQVKNGPVCFVCQSMALLSCNSCATYYCSPDCQQRDWFAHAQRHAEVKAQKASMSVNAQLQNAMDTDTSITNNPEKPSSMEVDDVATRFSDVELTNHPMVELHNMFDRPVACINKFRRPGLIPNNIKDENDFFHAIVSSIDITDKERIVYSVYLANYKHELNVYKNLLNTTYSDDDQVQLKSSAADYARYSKSLMMINFNNQWSRCVEISVLHDVVLLEDIDSGKKISLPHGFAFKVPHKQELARNSFAFKVTLKNLSDSTAVDVGDIIKIRILHLNLREISTAEIELTKTVNDEPMRSVEEGDAENQTEAQKPPTDEPRILIRQMKVKNFPPGRHVLTYLDGSKLSLGKLHVCLSTPENDIMLDQLYKDIQDYVDKNEDKNGYKPVVGELVLARFKLDDSFYRAVCLSVSDIDCKISFIDYGSDTVIPYSDVYKLPEQFLTPCISRSIPIKIASGKNLKYIDVEETVEKLLNAAKFEGVIECLPNNKFALILDDSLVVFK